ncbi:hypothetical protein [Bordetella petrii]|uniref:hypothetical protein n=1 Tax=Bordetella petrii TaxID=94624 RepID=UPI001A97B25E|nr:hypothetical protein [Bordetella petrii]MBO1112779.1 hypothetical protein [Bordetella petrii]
MNKTALSGLAALACLLGALGTAQAQQAREYSFPSHDGSKSPPSTLRITEQPGAAPAPAVRDTPESVQQYQRCRARVDREAIGNVDLQAGVAGCLKELEARRVQ